MRRYLPAALSLVAGLLLGGLVLIWAGPPASAFVPSPTRVTPQEEKAFRMKKFLMRTSPSGTTTAAQAAANQKVVTFAARGRLVGLGAHAIKGGLAGVAVGVWVDNFVTLYYGLNPEIADPVYVGAQMRQAQYGAAAQGASGANIGYVENGRTIVSGMITSARYKYVDGACTITFDATWQRSDQRYGQVGNGGTTGGTSSGCGQAAMSLFVPTTSSTTADSGSTGHIYGPRGASETGNCLRFAGKVTGSANGYVPFGDCFSGTSPDHGWENPVFDWGASTMLDAPPAGRVYQASPEQSDALYTDIKNETCTPTAPPETTPEVCPDYFPQEWEEEFPDINQPGEQDDPYGDPDGDEIPNHTDPDDDGDEVPDEEDEQPYVPLPQSPAGDPDGDGVPNKDDPDDDNDGIPDTDDPEPKTPTNPATLPRDHPYADPDEDGTPNKDDPDNDGDGTPDTEDPEPNNPEVGAPDLDKDGIPDKSDGDQDGDDVPDWEDVERRTQAVPNQTPDGDDDGVPDWSDPWPGNPYAPADPTKDGDSDDVPDYKDPEPAQPNVPMSPWPSGSPGDVPNNPGEPNIPANPTNPNHPPSSSTPAEPTDPSSPLDPNAPINPSAPENPGEPGGPPGEGDGCPVARQSAFKLPTIEVASVFPFNLVVWCYGAVASLHEPPSAPEWEVPFLGIMNLSTQEGLFGAVRTVLTSLILIALVMGWYSYIKGSEA